MPRLARCSTASARPTSGSLPMPSCSPRSGGPPLHRPRATRWSCQAAANASSRTHGTDRRFQARRPAVRRFGQGIGRGRSRTGFPFWSLPVQNGCGPARSSPPETAASLRKPVAGAPTKGRPIDRQHLHHSSPRLDGSAVGRCFLRNASTPSLKASFRSPVTM